MESVTWKEGISIQTMSSKYEIKFACFARTEGIDGENQTEACVAEAFSCTAEASIYFRNSMIATMFSHENTEVSTPLFKTCLVMFAIGFKIMR